MTIFCLFIKKLDSDLLLVLLSIHRIRLRRSKVGQSLTFVKNGQEELVVKMCVFLGQKLPCLQVKVFFGDPLSEPVLQVLEVHGLVGGLGAEDIAELFPGRTEFNGGCHFQTRITNFLSKTKNCFVGFGSLPWRRQLTAADFKIKGSRQKRKQKANYLREWSIAIIKIVRELGIRDQCRRPRPLRLLVGLRDD